MKKRVRRREKGWEGRKTKQREEKFIINSKVFWIKLLQMNYLLYVLKWPFSSKSISLAENAFSPGNFQDN